MRRMSFSATVKQMRNQTKTVTRRAPETWKNLEPGDQLLAVEKAMGLKPGEKQVPIGVIEIVDNRTERIENMTDDEVAAEGFPGLTVEDFLDEVWRPLHGKRPLPSDPVRRISFRHRGRTDG